MTRVAAVDGNYYLHRIFHTQVAASGEGIAHRFLALICKDALAIKAKRLVVALDGPDVFRHRLVDNYKANRSKEGEEQSNKHGLIAEDGPYTYLKDVKDTLDLAGICHVQLDEYEADDILASVAKAQPDVALLCRDKDIYQTLRPGVFQYDSVFRVKGVSKPRTIKHKDVEGIFGVPVELCVDLQTLTGDSIDNIPSLVRRDVAIRGLLKHGSLKAWLREDVALSAKLRPNKHILSLNRKLVKLVDDIKIEVKPVRWSSDKRLPKAYFQLKDFCNPRSKGLF